MPYFIVAISDGQSNPVAQIEVPAEGAYYAAVAALRVYLLDAEPNEHLYFEFVRGGSGNLMQAYRHNEPLDIYIDLSIIWSTEHVFKPAGATKPTSLYPVVPHHV